MIKLFKKGEKTSNKNKICTEEIQVVNKCMKWWFTSVKIHEIHCILPIRFVPTKQKGGKLRYWQRYEETNSITCWLTVKCHIFSEGNTAISLNIKIILLDPEILFLETYIEIHAKIFKDTFIIRVFNTTLLKFLKMETIPVSISNKVFDNQVRKY